MFETKNLNIKINDRYIIKDFSLTLNSKDKLAIIGEEGNGKSTLLKSLLVICEYAEITGSINSKDYRIGYLKQSMVKEDLNKHVYDFLFKDETDYYEKTNKLYKNLDTINLTDDILNQAIATLSGGEKVKINILKLLLDEYDILFLDEPTRNVSPLSNPVIRKVLREYNGTIISVSHDRKYIEEIIDTLYILTKEGLTMVNNDKNQPQKTYIK